MPTELFETVNSLIEEELALYESLASLVDTEDEKVTTSDMEGLLEVLQRKQSTTQIGRASCRERV